MQSRGGRSISNYRRSRQKFAFCVYGLTVVWLILALVQWYFFNNIITIKNFLIEHYYVSLAVFMLAMVLITIFIFCESVRFITVLNWLIAIMIVEGVIIGVTALGVYNDDMYILGCFGVVALLIAVFLLIGSIIPRDLTLDVVILFVISFIIVIITVYFALFYLLSGKAFAFYIYAGFLTFVVLLFVMYHAQTINGGRFAEMRLNDYLLATLILFHDFVVIYMLTFYAAKKILVDGNANGNMSNITTTTTPNAMKYLNY